MFSQRRTYFMIGFILILTGCTFTNTNQTTVPNEKKEVPIIKKTIIKKPVKKRNKKVFTYKHCRKHANIMTHASKYIVEEFEKGYLFQKDIVGAKAQLFLIESKSQSIFSKNINNAINSYNSQYLLAKKNKCNLSKFKTKPIEIVKRKINLLEKEILKKELKK